MPDLLNGISQGTAATGTSTARVFKGGRYSALLASNVPGNEVNGSGIGHNMVAFMAGYLHSQLTDTWASCQPDGTTTPAWTNRNTERVAGNDEERMGFQPCLTSSGPGLVTAWRNPAAAGRTRVARWDAATDSITYFDQPSGTAFATGYALYTSAVFGNLLFISGATSLIHVCDLETGAFTVITGASGFFADCQVFFAEANGNFYGFGQDGSNYPEFRIFLGGAFVSVAKDVSLGGLGVMSNSAGRLMWRRGGYLYGCAKLNIENGWRMWRLNLSTGVMDDNSSALPAMLKHGGGLPVLANAATWTCGFYVDVDDLGAPRYMIQVFPNTKANAPACVLFEHTDAGVVLFGGTEINGGSNCTTIHHKCVAGLTYKDGQLWAAQWAKPVSDPLGMLLTFRVGGDAGNADTYVRLTYAAPPGACDSRAGKLVAPAGGLGQVGASLYDEGGGVYRVEGWDADGATNLQVIHRTIQEGIPNGVIGEWIAKASKTV